VTRATTPVLLALALVGCDSRSREIKARLDPSQVARFEKGQRLAAPCWSCHDLYTPAHKIGPSLLGMFGRRAGAAPGFHYSRAMQESRVVWDAGSVRRFLRDVPGYIPGNNMVSPSLGASEADAVTFYLEHVTRP
jgi:cytochrome c